jgi:putative ABC transport system substrate-binding protein
LLSALALANRIPTFSNNEVAVEAGGLVCYGASGRKVLRRTGYYVKKILDGANAGDLTVEQPIGLELIINLKTAKAWDRNLADPACSRRQGDRIMMPCCGA